MNGKGLHQVNGSFYMSKENPFELEMDFRYIYDERLPLGENCIRLYDSKQAYDFKTLNIKSLYSGADEQPYIEKISPSGGSYGDTIQIVGRNFGKDIDNIQIVTLSGMKDEINQFGEDELDENIVPYYISDFKDEKKTQVMEFTIPKSLQKDIEEKFSFGKRLFGATLQLRLMVNYRPAKIIELTILPTYWKFVGAFSSLLLTVIFISIITFRFGVRDFLKRLCYDEKTNMYSLINMQSLSWTLVLMGSYFYVAICMGGILQNSSLPDFNLKLIALMGISFAGVVSDKLISNKKQTHEVKVGNPSWKDLFCSASGSVDLPKLQLLGFTLISILIYLYYLLLGNVLNGLPDIPASLHTLLTVSQAGYLGEKGVSLASQKEETKPVVEKPISEPEQAK